MSRKRVTGYQMWRHGQTSPQETTYEVDENGNFYSPGSTGVPFLDFLYSIPRAIGSWIGQGVNAYKQSSTEFERFWNSPSNQMAQYSAAGINPYEGFLSGSGGNGNPISPSDADPLASMMGYIQNFVSLAHGLADLRSKKIANDSSAIDLLRKQFTNKWFFGDPGTLETEEYTDENGQTHVVTTRKGFIQPEPEIEYETKRFGRDSARYRVPHDRYDALVYDKKIDKGYYDDDADFDYYEKYYRINRDRMNYEWEKFLKEDLGIDPRSSPWLISFMKFLDNQSKADGLVPRMLFGLLQFLKGNY